MGSILITTSGEEGTTKEIADKISQAIGTNHSIDWFENGTDEDHYIEIVFHDTVRNVIDECACDGLVKLAKEIEGQDEKEKDEPDTRAEVMGRFDEANRTKCLNCLYFNQQDESISNYGEGWVYSGYCEMGGDFVHSAPGCKSGYSPIESNIEYDEDGFKKGEC